jgi:signal peptidase II
VAVAVIVVDQLTKVWALSALADGPINLLGPLRLFLTRNTAGAFGLGGAAVPFLAVGALILVVVMASSGATTRSPLLAVAVGLVLGGAVGNLIDRLVRGRGFLQGAVVDFIDLQFWPVFNVADMAITCGCIVLVWAGFRSK